ncbi:DMT family transporter [Streptomyces sp. NPDC048376]|jgi:transporter family-2 protein|uniref:DMT family transporter n=1 Tax=unclassified Streptomyces TaxID=2593676 RepID=UPI003447818D
MEHTTQSPRPRRAAFAAAIPLLVILGGVLAVQTRFNGELGRELDDGFLAAALIFSVGFVLASLGLLASHKARQGFKRVYGDVRAGRLPWWALLGGAVGSVFVLGQGLVASVVGTAVFSIAAIAGQTLGGLLVDRLGIGTGGKRPMDRGRILGSLLALGAVAWSVSSDIGGDFPMAALILPIVGGLCLGWQQAVNGRVRLAAESALTATVINFFSGAIVTILVAAVHITAVGHFPALPGQWWLYVGGMTAVLFIAATSVLVRKTGVLLLGIGTTAGQLLVSLLLDTVFPQSGRTVGWTTVAGTLLAVVAVLVVSLSGANGAPAVKPRSRPAAD